MDFQELCHTAVQTNCLSFRKFTFVVFGGYALRLASSGQSELSKYCCMNQVFNIDLTVYLLYRSDIISISRLAKASCLF